MLFKPCYITLTAALIALDVNAKIANNDNMDFLPKWPKALSSFDYRVYYNEPQNAIKGWTCATGTSATVGVNNELLVKMKSPCAKDTGLLIRNISFAKEIHNVDTACLTGSKTPFLMLITRPLLKQDV